MQYEKFIIYHYRAIDGPLEINIGRNSLIPIIGVNECGKTTILNGIFCFDRYNDNFLGGLHLKDTQNLYTTSPKIPFISAEVKISWEEFLEKLKRIEKNNSTGNTENLSPALMPEIKKGINSYKKQKSKFSENILIDRNLNTKTYQFRNSDLFWCKPLNELLIDKIVKALPYILYFDDFRDSVEEKIEIKKEKNGDIAGWLSILETLFKKTEEGLSVFSLIGMDDRQRKSVLAKVMKKLNVTLTKEWQNFKLDDSDALNISLEYAEESVVDSNNRSYIKLDIVEKDSLGNDHYFYIRNRSKGFFWFFNFVMKLEFNPKETGNAEYRSIFLLDEPGSYLHAFAQSKLCKKLKSLSEKNKVIYCTHSHYLLDPETIPVNLVRISNKNTNGNISLSSIHEYHGNITERRTAFQPLIDALQIKPFLLDLTANNFVITEGIYDYYSLEMFKGNRTISFLPSVGAASIKYFVSIMLAWQIKYAALWDNDEEGQRSLKDAREHFGDAEAQGKFLLLPFKSARAKKIIIQNYFSASDMKMIRQELNVPPNASFEKVILELFYSPKKLEILKKITQETKNNFELLFQKLDSILSPS